MSRAARLLIALFLAATGAAAGRPLLVDVTAASGVAFTHHAAGSDAWLLPETMGSGVALFDADGDGDLDILLLDSGSPPGAAKAVAAESQFLRNVAPRPGAPLRFERGPAPDSAGLSAMGACTGDVDSDGDVDVYVTGLPRGRLLLNAGGRVAPSTDSGIDDSGWGTSCVLFDADRDGALDLFVAHYVKWSSGTERSCGGEKPGFRSYCPPDAYEPEQDRLFRGDGKGRFVDATSGTGFGGERGKGLGVLAADIDQDGGVDLYVANDQTPSSLWLRTGSTFRDVGLVSGTALSEEGKAQAGMGIDTGDVDGDGRLDLFKTNLDLDTNNVYVQLSGAGVPRFRDAVRACGAAEPSFIMVGFGAVLADSDSDGDSDAFVANGHVMPNIAALRPDQTHAMRSQLLVNEAARPGEAPRFRDAVDLWLPASEERGVGRGLAVGDLDDDGDLDIVETRNGGAARVLRNDSNPRRWIGLVLRTTRSAPGAPGATVRLACGGRTWMAARRAGGSYLSASDDRVLFALARAPEGAPINATVTWPSGAKETFPGLEANAYRAIVEGKGTKAP